MRILETIKKPVIISKVMAVVGVKDKWMRTEYDNGRITWEPLSYDGEGEDETGELEKEYQALVNKPNVLFTTFDGVEITQLGTEVYSLLLAARHGRPVENTTVINEMNLKLRTSIRASSSWKHFSTPELRKKYLIENVACLSIADIRHEDYNNLSSPQTKSITELEQLVKVRME